MTDRHKPYPMPASEGAIKPLELQQLDVDLDGSRGLYRNPDAHLALTRATNDLAAIEEWLDTAGVRSRETLRTYRKEAERLLAWAIVERGKPISSLDVQDMLAYERFLANPVSRHPGVEWVAAPYVNPATGAKSVRRYRRDDPNWRPFDGPLTLKSIEHALQILKSLFSFWTDMGYTVVNPLKVRRRRVPAGAGTQASVKDRVLTRDTWRFLYDCLDRQEERIPDTVKPAERLRLLRQANQRYLILSCLYLLGVRIAELAQLTMADFTRRETREGVSYWVHVAGKGGKERTIPVPVDLIDVIARHRRLLNTFPVRRAGDQRGGLRPTPSPGDQTPLALSAAGTRPMSANGIHRVVKGALQDAAARYHELAEAGEIPEGVIVEQLEHATAHWMRHTSATHQSLEGVSLRYIKDYLGHASYDTTTIYDHISDEHWVAQLAQFGVKKT